MTGGSPLASSLYSSILSMTSSVSRPMSHQNLTRISRASDENVPSRQTTKPKLGGWDARLETQRVNIYDSVVGVPSSSLCAANGCRCWSQCDIRDRRVSTRIRLSGRSAWARPDVLARLSQQPLEARVRSAEIPSQDERHRQGRGVATGVSQGLAKYSQRCPTMVACLSRAPHLS